MTRQKTLGFDRRLELSWLDATAAIAARGEALPEARARLNGILEEDSGSGGQKGRRNTITVLSRIWLNGDGALADLRGRSLGLLEAASAQERLAIHWAMCCASHPFFLDVAAALGRLLRLQGDVSLSQVTRRVTESWGDRSTLRRAVQRVCRSLIDWGVLSETSTRGIYKAGPNQPEMSGAVARLLIEALLIGGPRPASPLMDLVRHPALFPFSVTLTGSELRGQPEFRVDRQGLDVDVVGLTAAG
jgi:hypothetical protein